MAGSALGPGCCPTSVGPCARCRFVFIPLQKWVPPLKGRGSGP
ncbi:hypothetical protein HMPREF0262_00913 [Clostridium sp. ATCC 29733]|nr:hypothetical protein HMPREF0262_00913 [Clostridium sp. ATCC 29733]